MVVFHGDESHGRIIKKITLNFYFIQDNDHFIRPHFLFINHRKITFLCLQDMPMEAHVFPCELGKFNVAWNVLRDVPL